MKIQLCLLQGRDKNMNFDLREKAKENIIVVAHRGAAGGNIPCNTLASYEIALKQGADMLGISQSYISRLEKRIIEKIKTELQKAM